MKGERYKFREFRSRAENSNSPQMEDSTMLQKKFQKIFQNPVDKRAITCYHLETIDCQPKTNDEKRDCPIANTNATRTQRAAALASRIAWNIGQRFRDTGHPKSSWRSRNNDSGHCVCDQSDRRAAEQSRALTTKENPDCGKSWRITQPGNTKKFPLIVSPPLGATRGRP